MYTLGKQCRRTRVAHNFGNAEVIPAVDTYCMSAPSDVCEKCENYCDRDYWQMGNENYLCHECWYETKVFKDKYIKRLRKYKV